MKILQTTAGSLLLALAYGVQCDAFRNIIYFDQYHTTTIPSRDRTATITHVVMAFANSSLFIGDTVGEYVPFMAINHVRALFNKTALVGIALGGWGDTEGFGEGAKDEESRKTYAQNVKAMTDTHGFDFVDIDWEYPGGNGEDYKQKPNSEKIDEITTFPLLLAEIKAAISPKPLSIATPGKAEDMIAYTQQQSQAIWDAVDFVNIMTYDLMNRRNTETKHHTDIVGSLNAVENYLDLGLCASKINLGFAFYAKYFRTESGVNCTEIPVGCPIVKAENDDGSDAGTSGAMTFETANVSPTIPTKLTASVDGSCGINTFYTCSESTAGTCCSAYGYCGSSDAHCGTGCQSAYGTGCQGISTTESFANALKYGQADEVAGGQWYWDGEAELFWTFDTAALIQRKFEEIVEAKGLGGVFAWSLGEDSYNWSHITAITQGVKAL